ncbi:TPA: helix-turn-helix domain-containing protein [Clostridioides difficile]|uniref:phage terminase small subunit n=2 Tax=Clostridioides difficile TaxID=1496 RepID=UPI00038C9125|nr:phage terminase small subunit [Clostridioides difficile]EQE66359.1 ATPase subunit of terminase family protein [Clostridioides difficile CD44]MBH7578817.1 helix-turn-helix domain-containing protein [Clostridioides difficile]MBY1074861.1 helix-turn-helix domain-containing protein [Clostridioides difficile]MBY1892905.1 helix-turn-helix domain-containing protein [Clostridioides difficile]MCJ0329420.1 helix-turn-helix domain-containing protein [Clostridioides difficile]
MNEKADLAHEDYLKGLKYKEIAEKHNVSLSTVKSWATRYWKQKGCNQPKKVATKKRGAPIGNTNATGPPGNKNAEKFGFFSKYLPEETQDLINEIKNKDKFDILWEQITIQYAAIIRAQKIMYVKDKEEMIKELKKHESTENGEKIEYEFQFAWDRQASFLNAQSRAMSELRSLIKQYDEMIHKDWNLATEEQRARVEVLKSKINNQESKEDKLDRYFDKLESVIKND